MALLFILPFAVVSTFNVVIPVLLENSLQYSLQNSPPNSPPNNSENGYLLLNYIGTQHLHLSKDLESILLDYYH